MLKIQSLNGILENDENLNTSISIQCIMLLSLLHERRINVKKSNQGDGVPAANAAGSSSTKTKRVGAYSFPACYPALKGQCEGQAGKRT